MGAERAKFEKEMKEKDSAATQQRDAAEAERMKKVRSMKDDNGLINSVPIRCS